MEQRAIWVKQDLSSLSETKIADQSQKAGWLVSDISPSRGTDRTIRQKQVLLGSDVSGSNSLSVSHPSRQSEDSTARIYLQYLVEMKDQGKPKVIGPSKELQERIRRRRAYMKSRPPLTVKEVQESVKNHLEGGRRQYLGSSCEQDEAAAVRSNEKSRLERQVIYLQPKDKISTLDQPLNGVPFSDDEL